MPPIKVSHSNIYFVWQKTNSLRAKIPHRRVKFRVGDLVRKTKKKVKFAKGYEQKFSTEIFQDVKVIQRMPQPIFEFAGLQSRPIEGKFHNYELSKSLYRPKQIDKIVRTRNKSGIKQHLVKWKGYDETFKFG